MDNPKQATRKLARAFADRGKPNDWFEDFYARAGGDHRKIYWADLAPSPKLIHWLERNPPAPGARAATVGCGLGDDAEALAARGFQVTAFDISVSAIDMCRRRFPESPVDYRVADLFNGPADWRHGFDLVYECNTIQVLVDAARERSIPAIAGLVAPEGHLLVSCRSRETGQGLDVWPLALDRPEIDRFLAAGLREIHFDAYDDDQDPPVPHYFSVYRRPGP